MPMVTLKLIEGVFTAEQKQDMIRKITNTMVEIEGENLRPVTWVLVEEAHSGDWGIAGNGPITGRCARLAGAAGWGHRGLSLAPGTRPHPNGQWR